MSKLKDMELKEIFKRISTFFSQADIANFCDDSDVINEYLYLYEDYDEKPELIEELLLKNEEKINKEKLVFNLFLNYKENISIINDRITKIINSLQSILNSNPSIRKVTKEAKINNIEEFRRFLNENQKNIMLGFHMTKNQNLIDNFKEQLEELQRLDLEKEYEETQLKKCKKLLENLEIYLPVIEVKENKIEMKIVNSQEETRNKKKNAENKIRRIDDIDAKIGNDGNGLVYVVQSLVLSDLSYIIPDLKIGSELREVILNNTLLKNEKISVEEIEKLREENFEEYDRLLQNVEKKEYLPELREEIRKNIRFIDIDKMLFFCLYRLEEYMETRTLSKENYQNCKNLAYYIMGKIQNKNVEINETLERLSTYELVDVKYSYKDAEKYVSRLSEEEYISKQKIEDTKRDIINGKININVVDISILNLLEFKEEEIDQIMNISTENFAFVIELMNFTEQQILEKLLTREKIIPKDLLAYLIEIDKLSDKSFVELYYANKVRAEFFKEFSEELDISSEVNLQTINELYNQIKNSKQKNEEDIGKLNKQTELYRTLKVKNKEELEEVSNNIKYKIAEDDSDILFYYKNGLLTLSAVADWDGDKLVEKLYNESEITFQDLENLYINKKISQKLIEKAILENKELDYSELMAYIYLKYISESHIEKMYMEGKLFDEDLREIAIQKIITPQKFLELTESRTQDILEKNAKITLEPILVNVPDSKMKLNIVEDGIKKISGGGKTKEIIDPAARELFFEKLGAIKAKAIIPDEDNAFYDYDFYVIPNMDGEFDTESVVIAERFYKNREAADEFVTDNATYFFQYKDLMVNSNLSKKEMMQDKRNIVFTANHRIGSWAVSVLYKIAQTHSSSDFKEYTKGDKRAGRVIDELRKIYTDSQLNEILDMVKEIDDEQLYTYEEVNQNFVAKGNNSGFSQTDDDAR